jgi:hypothetical protein
MITMIMVVMIKSNGNKDNKAIVITIIINILSTST